MKISCEDCICLPMCRKKDLLTFYRDCSMVSNFMSDFSEKVRKKGVVGVDDPYKITFDQYEQIKRKMILVYKNVKFGIIK